MRRAIVDDYAAIAARMRELRDGPARFPGIRLADVDLAHLVTHRADYRPMAQFIAKWIRELDQQILTMNDVRAAEGMGPPTVSAAYIRSRFESAREEIGLIQSSVAARPTNITPEALEAWQAGILEAVERGLRCQDHPTPSPDSAQASAAGRR